MGALVSLLIVLSLSLLITRIASVALQQTGLSRESAKFQARSAFTGVGFTTSEAEAIARHPVRRRIAAALMLLGNVGVVTSISSLILAFIDTRQTSGWLWRLLGLVLGVAVLWALASSQWVEVRLSRLIERALRRWTDLDIRDYGRLLHLSGDYELVELEVTEGDWLCERTLSEARLRQEGVEVLGIKRADGRYVGVPWGSACLHAGDTLVLYGRNDSLENLDVRQDDHEGEREHHDAVARQQQVLSSEKSQDARAEQQREAEPTKADRPHES